MSTAIKTWQERAGAPVDADYRIWSGIEEDMAAEIADLRAALRAPVQAQGVAPATELTDDLINLLNDIRPNFGDVGTRDVDVVAQRKRIDRAIVLLGLIVAHDGREHPTPRPLARAALAQAQQSEDARHQRLLSAASGYANDYLQDERDEPDMCHIEGQHAAIVELFAAIAALTGSGAT